MTLCQVWCYRELFATQKSAKVFAVRWGSITTVNADGDVRCVFSTSSFFLFINLYLFQNLIKSLFLTFFMKTCVVAFGGSIVIPGSAYDQKVMTELADILRDNKDTRFVLIIGGGKLCRNITESIRHFFVDANLSSNEIDVANDEVGIAITKVNSRKVISSLTEYLGDDVVYSEYIDNPEIIPTTSHRVFIASGFKPGVTTDFCMMRLANNFKADSAFKISNFPVVLNVKPTEFNKVLLDTYEKVPKMSWSEMVDLVGSEFIPGGNYPLDPSAAKLGLDISKENKPFTLYIGEKDEFEKMIKNEDFIGTVIRNE